ncbi:MAG: cob(I)yrinic acid a,c-diamide adenosyltransferase [Fibrobacter sp.]|nr:cob(I)yrinic acid a,c-diamide adenosyltransferase [Fibrobacter sp.]
MMKKGLLIVNTGNGKGKTTAALGMAFRALGHGMRVCVIQFIKGSWKYGELESAKRFSDLLEFHVMGKGFTWKSENIDEDKAAARDAWDFAKVKISSNEFGLVILDELTYLVKFGMVSEEEIMDILCKRPQNLHVVVTGRYAGEQLIANADLVTQMVAEKHPLKNGIKAQKGVEF